MKGILLTAVLAASALAIPANAQYGGIVLDPVQSAHAVQQLVQGSELYTTTIKTLTNVMLTYNLAHRMATAPSSYYTAFSNMGVQMWTQVTRPANTYGNSLPWMNAATTGNGAAAAYQSASVPRTGQISGYSALNSQGQQAVAAQQRPTRGQGPAPPASLQSRRHRLRESSRDRRHAGAATAFWPDPDSAISWLRFPKGKDCARCIWLRSVLAFGCCLPDRRGR